MSENAAEARMPQWDLADRMRKALREAGLGVQQMATYLDVDRSTVSTWINGRITPSTQTQRLWALRCGVPYEWLIGDAPTGPRPGGGSDVPNTPTLTSVDADARTTWCLREAA